jgi:hypothetical protein
MAVALTAQKKNVAVETIGTSCTTPTNPYRKMAYYLKSVHGTSVPENIPSCLYNWETMSDRINPSREDIRIMLSWCERYSPPTMRSQGFFIMVSDSDANKLFPGFSNEFLKITTTSQLFCLVATTQAGVLANHSNSSSITVMLYKECWEDNHYYEARKELREALFSDVEDICLLA